MDKNKKIIAESTPQDATDEKIIISEDKGKDFDGDMVIINPDAVKREYGDSIYTRLLDALSRYCEDTGTKLNISEERIKKALTLKDLDDKTEFNELLRTILTEFRDAVLEEEHKKQSGYRPTKYSQLVTKVTDELPQLDFTEDETKHQYVVSKKHAKKECVVLLATDNTALTERGISQFDNSVFNTVCSFIDAGETKFTLAQIANYLHHGDDTISKAGKGQQERVQKSINKQMGLLMDIDYTQHLMLNGVSIQELGRTGIAKRARLPLTEYQIKNGDVVEGIGYTVDKLPPEYEYAKDVKQIATVDACLLDVPVELHMREKDIVWRDYIIREIDTMKKNRTYSRDTDGVPVLKVDTLFEKCGIIAETRKARYELLKRIEILLSDYMRKNDFYSYERKLGKNRRVDGYRIYLSEKMYDTAKKEK